MRSPIPCSIGPQLKRYLFHSLALTVLAAGASCTDGTSGIDPSLPLRDSGTEGPASDTSGAREFAPPTPAFTFCPPERPKSCDPETWDVYQKCVRAVCVDAFAECYGDQYETGVPGGSCKEERACVNACGCGDGACARRCACSDDCRRCKMTIDSCSMACNRPVCHVIYPGETP